ncbi:hypothetical protein SAMN04515674_105288 [Pseudarcicella hirudinis]|uniref:Uncharacterized protein n=1 Tax=Pseudarcicella hirudinis TaxID=1079859 RepID=A0A1I5SZ22_9BACT|nr:hypothetical protein [Pseudarcicella hirudinis]SFP76022.1 hypothetical protein SAMN04515674_105288 [Pseudarcicella hirudinis]
MTKKSLPAIIEKKGFVFSEIKFSASPEDLKQYTDLLSLKVDGIQDKDGLKKCYDARQTLKKIRIAVTKEKKELDDEVKEQSKQQLAEISAEYQKIVDLITPVETHLQLEEARIEEEKQRIKKEQEEQEALRLSSRVERLLSFGFVFSGIFYKLLTITNETLQVEFVALKTMPDEEFEDFAEKGKIEYDKLVAHREELARIAKEEEQKRLAEAEALRKENIRLKEEAERIIKEEQEKANKERIELERVQKEKSDLQAKRLQELLPYSNNSSDIDMASLYTLTEKEYQLTLALKKSEFEKNEIARIELEKQHNEALIAEKQRLEAIAKEQQAFFAKIKVEQQELEAQKRKIEGSELIIDRLPELVEGLTPEQVDIKNILAYSDRIEAIELPELKSSAGLFVRKEIEKEIEKLTEFLNNKAESLL